MRHRPLPTTNTAIICLLMVAVFLFGLVLTIHPASRISIQTELEGTRATISCADTKAPNEKHLTTPTKREIVVLDCERSK